MSQIWRCALCGTTQHVGICATCRRQFCRACDLNHDCYTRPAIGAVHITTSPGTSRVGETTMTDQTTTTAQTTDQETVGTLDQLLDLARDRGATRIKTEPVGWLDETGGLFPARATIVTAEGTEIIRYGYARPGDCQGGATEDQFPAPARAETRALAAAMRTAYGQEPAGAQSSTLRRAQGAIRDLAQRLGCERDEIARAVHARWHVASTAHLTDEQASQVYLWALTIARLDATVDRVVSELEVDRDQLVSIWLSQWQADGLQDASTDQAEAAITWAANLVRKIEEKA